MANSYAPKLSIKAWAEEDRPREKLLDKGRNFLSDAELLAILIGSGNTHETAVELCKRILGDVSNNLNNLAQLTVSDLIKYKGIGEAKAISIVAALELGRRRKEQMQVKKLKISNSDQAYQFIRHKLEDLPYEVFYAIYLNRANIFIKDSLISRGGISGTVVDIKIILKEALECYAQSIILVHNHPSGNLKPSQADINLTNNMIRGASYLEMSVVDHIIIGNDEFYSFSDDGKL